MNRTLPRLLSAAFFCLVPVVRASATGGIPFSGMWQRRSAVVIPEVSMNFGYRTCGMAILAMFCCMTGKMPVPLVEPLSCDPIRMPPRCSIVSCLCCL